MNTAQIVQHQLAQADIKWRFGTDTRCPTIDEVETMIETMKDQLSDNSSITSGGLHMEHIGKHYDIYVFVRDIGE